MIGVFFILYKKKRKYNIDYNKLNERQKDIVSFLIKRKGECLQVEIERGLKLPKSSLSRNINSLIKKEIIIKNNVGMSNKISLCKK